MSFNIQVNSLEDVLSLEEDDSSFVLKFMDGWLEGTPAGRCFGVLVWHPISIEDCGGRDREIPCGVPKWT